MAERTFVEVQLRFQVLDEARAAALLNEACLAVGSVLDLDADATQRTRAEFTAEYLVASALSSRHAEWWPEGTIGPEGAEIRVEGKLYILAADSFCLAALVRSGGAELPDVDGAVAALLASARALHDGSWGLRLIDDDHPAEQTSLLPFARRQLGSA